MRFVLVSYSEINKLYSTETDPQNPAISNKLALLVFWLVDGSRFPINISVEWKQSRRVYFFHDIHILQREEKMTRLQLCVLFIFKFLESFCRYDLYFQFSSICRYVNVPKKFVFSADFWQEKELQVDISIKLKVMQVLQFFWRLNRVVEVTKRWLITAHHSIIRSSFYF